MLTRLLLLGCVGLLGWGCNDAEGWRPPAPAGVTYTYDYQGFQQKERGGFGGVVAVTPVVGVAYGGAFNFRQGSELGGNDFKEPFAQSTPINGVQFNQHLGSFGKPLAPAPLPGAPASGSAAPSASGAP